jgi:hypothetical protein
MSLRDLKKEGKKEMEKEIDNTVKTMIFLIIRGVTAKKGASLSQNPSLISLLQRETISLACTFSPFVKGD